MQYAKQYMPLVICYVEQASEIKNSLEKNGSQIWSETASIQNGRRCTEYTIKATFDTVKDWAATQLCDIGAIGVA